MVIKSKTFKKLRDIKYAVNYILDKKERYTDKTGQSFIWCHNMRFGSNEDLTRQLEANEAYRKYQRKGSIKLYHDIVSFHAESSKNLSIEKLERIARAYVKERGRKGVYLGAAHFDKEHIHLHIVYSPLEYKSSKNMRLSREDFKQFKIRMQEFQQKLYPELHKSIVNHAQKAKGRTITDREYRAKQRSNGLSLKDQAVQVIQQAFGKAGDRNTFYGLLEQKGLILYKRAGAINGIVINGRKHRLSTLGFDKEKLNELDRLNSRQSELKSIRKSKGERERSVNRSR